MSIWRSGFVPVGLVLLLLGIGNWIVGARKVAEYERLLSKSERPLRVGRFVEFRELSARTNATLLRPFQGVTDNTDLIGAKLDFYQIVHAGGRLLTLTGLFVMTAGLVHDWYRRRFNGRDGLVAHSG